MIRVSEIKKSTLFIHLVRGYRVMLLIDHVQYIYLNNEYTTNNQ